MSAYLFTFASIFCASVLLIRGICVAAKANSETFVGSKFQMFALAASLWMIIGGGVGFAMGLEKAPLLMLLGCASHIIFDRRRNV